MRPTLLSLLVPLAAGLFQILPSPAQGSWDNVGPPGGYFEAIAADPADPRHVVVFSAEAVFETRDAGSTWRRSSPPCGTRGGTIRVRQAEVRGQAFYVNCGSELQRSADAGATWQRYSKTSGEWWTYTDFAVHPSAPATTVAATDDWFEVTRDDGASWSTSPDYTDYFTPLMPSGLTFDPRSSGRLLAIRNGAPRANYGSNAPATQLEQNGSMGMGEWSTVSTVYEFGFNSVCFGRDLAVDGGGIMYVTSDCRGVLVSRDEGRSWEQHAVPEITASGLVSVRAASQRAGVAALRAFNRIMVTEDAGRTWSTLISGSQTEVAVAADGTFWAAEAGRLYRYDANGRTLMPVKRQAAGVYSFEAAGLNWDVLLASTESGAMRSADAGATWSPMAGAAAGLGRFLTVQAQPSSVYAVSDLPTRLWFSPDAGANWEQVSLPAVPTDYTQYGPFVPVGPQPGVVYGSWVKLPGGVIAVGSTPTTVAIRSTDGGRTWTSIDAGLGGTYREWTPAPGDASTAYMRTSTGVFRTRDAGATWRQIWAMADRGPVSAVTIDSGDPLVAYLIDADGSIWATEDGGDRWRAGAAATASEGLARLLADPADSRRAFAVSSSGAVFETRDAARSWNRLSVGAQSPFVDARRVAARGGGRSILGSNTNTVLSIDLSQPHPIALGTDLWWNPAQPGWGLSVVQHEDLQVFAIWFTYDERGRPTWRFVPGGAWTDATTFTGALYVATVPPREFFASAFTAPTVTLVGTATLRFDGADSGEAAFTVGATTLRQPITRMKFGPVGKTGIGLADLWFNPSQSGWGISMHQQYSTLFATWFVYDVDGTPTWLFLPNATTAGGTMSGDVFRAMSIAGAAYEAHGVTVSKVGTASYAGQDVSTLSATIDGRSWTSPISRLPF